MLHEITIKPRSTMTHGCASYSSASFSLGNFGSLRLIVWAISGEGGFNGELHQLLGKGAEVMINNRSDTFPVAHHLLRRIGSFNKQYTPLRPARPGRRGALPPYRRYILLAIFPLKRYANERFEGVRAGYTGKTGAASSRAAPRCSPASPLVRRRPWLGPRMRRRAAGHCGAGKS